MATRRWATSCARCCCSRSSWSWSAGSAVGSAPTPSWSRSPSTTSRSRRRRPTGRRTGRWRPPSSRTGGARPRPTWDPGTEHWHLGILTGDDAYVGVEQATGLDEDELLATYAEDAQPGGQVEVGSRRWQLYTDEGDDRTTLVRSDAGVAVLVTGSIPQDELATFVESLEPTGAGFRCPTCSR